MTFPLYDSPITNDIRIIFVDFDGTIKPAGAQVCQADIETTHKLKALGIVRVVATGRGLYSFQRDYPDKFDLDYLLFSSGLGLCPWENGPGPLSLSGSFTASDRERVLNASLKIKRGFFAFEPPPRCHFHVYQYPDGHPPTEGFLSRLKSYARFTEPYKPGLDLGRRSEFLIPAPSSDMPEVKRQFEKLCPGVSVLRSSSPYGDDSMWLEIFPPGINKGATAKFLADGLNFSAQQALALGNDFNDLELLSWAGLALVTENAPPDLKNLFPHIPAVTEKPLTYVLNLITAGLSHKNHKNGF
ncbi:MAG: Cof-type HAD-IIB family hydrolase [Deltaproteobacteria bacterium]|nr:Cof-type HAD-IIB family hydrolase [Deltaproteobacteria bacterium]